LSASAAPCRFDGSTIPRVMLHGPGCRRQAAIEAERIGVQRIVLVVSPSLRRQTTFVDEMQAILGDRCVGVLDDVVAHATDRALD
jgi:alcohol dehydrogenase class IV